MRVVRQNYTQGRTKGFTKTRPRSDGLADGVMSLIHEEVDAAERVTVGKEGVLEEIEFWL